ncbi:MAG: FAD:protein FMN transferase [Bacteroidales bacterium]|nr:FAD:protein FMN transferase [Bacteroidales bacterium]
MENKKTETDVSPTEMRGSNERASKSHTGLYLLGCVVVAVIVYLLLPDKPNPWRGLRGRQSEAVLHTIEGLAQGSYYRISYYDDVAAAETDVAGADAGTLLETALRHSIDSLLRTFDLRFSLWEDSSLLCRVNRNEDPELDAMFIDLFEKSAAVSAWTDGAFDITVAPLVKAYGFAKEAVRGHRLSAGTRDSLLARVGYEKAAIHGNRLVKQHPDLQLDFNAIAQGYCADLVAGFLDSRGLHRYLVDIGGEMRLKGRKNGGTPWQIAIERPADEASASRQIYHTIPLTDASIVTSGNYRKYFEENGRRFSHTISPKTGEPVRDSLLSATVICADAWEADAMATAFMVMGLEGTRRYLETHPDRYGVFLIYARSDGSKILPDQRFGLWTNWDD